MNILLVDDDKNMIKEIKKDLFIYFSECNNKVDFYTYSSNFLSINLDIEYDFIFIDIELLSENGIDIVRNIKYSQPKVRVIFMSGYLNLIHDSLLVQPFYFIRKTNYKEDLNKFFMILNQLEKVNEIICLNYKNEKTKVNINEIYYISSSGHELTVVTKNGKYSDNRKLKDFLNIVHSHDVFVKIHKSFIINLEYLLSYKKNTVTLIDKTEINIGRIYKEEFEKRFKEFLLR